jgi:hypothetical protein
MTGLRSFVIPVHSLNKFSEPLDFGYMTEICTLGADSSFGFLKSDRDGGRYSTLWTSTWEVVSSIVLHTTLRRTSDPIQTDGKGTSIDIASLSSSSNVKQSVVCMEAWITFNTSVRITVEGSLATLNPKTIMYRGMASFKSTTCVGPVSFSMTSSRVSTARHSYRIFFPAVTGPLRLSSVYLAYAS